MYSARFFLLFFLLQSILLSAQTKKIEPRKGLIFYVPSSFKQMTNDNLAQKYPSYKKPIAMFESENGKAEMGVNAAVNKWQNRNLTVLKDMYKSTIASIFTEVDFIQDGNIVEINQRKYVLFEFTSAIVDDKRIDETTVYTRRYNYLAYTIYKNKILVFNFNSSFGSKQEWMPIASEIMKSIKVTDKLKIEDFEPYKTQGPQPKSPPKEKDVQMDAFKELGKKKN